MPDDLKPTPDVPGPTSLQIQIPEHHFEVYYSDQAMVTHTPVGFTVDFAQMTPQAGLSRVVSRVGMSPAHLKLLIRTLTENLAAYEKQFGVVEVTPQMIEQHEQPVHHIGFQPDPEGGEAAPGRKPGS